MAVTFVDYAQASAISTSVTVSVPTHQSGDLLVAIVGRNTTGSDTISANEAGWTALTQINGASNSNGILYYRTATGSEPASYQFNGTSSRRLNAAIASYRGWDSVTASGAEQEGAGVSGVSLAVANDGSLWITATETASSADPGTPSATGGTLRFVHFEDGGSGLQPVTVWIGDIPVDTADSPTTNDAWTDSGTMTQAGFGLILSPSAGGSALLPMMLAHDQFNGGTV